MWMVPEPLEAASTVLASDYSPVACSQFWGQPFHVGDCPPLLIFFPGPTLNIHSASQGWSWPQKRAGSDSYPFLRA